MPATDLNPSGDTMTVPVEDVIHHLPLERVRPDPANIRVQLRDIEELCGSVLRNGVLDAITVREIAGGNGDTIYMVCRGHRRLAAAVEAHKIQPERNSIPARIVDAAQAERERVAHRMVENLQRDALTTAEVAQGVQQLLDLGATETEVSDDLGMSKADVAMASKVAGSKGVAVVTKRMDISMEEAAALAEFEGDKSVFKELTALVVDNPQRFTHRVAQYRRARQEHEAVEAVAPGWKTKGYKVLTWADANSTPVLPLHAVKPTKGNAKHMTVPQHADCPYRAVVLQLTRGATPDAVEVEHYCIDPVKAGHQITAKRMSWGGLEPVGAGAGKGTSKVKTEAEQLEGRTHRAGMAASRAARDVRTDFVRRLLLNVKPPKGLVPFIVTQLTGEHAGMESRVAPVFGELTGVSASNNYHGNRAVQGAFLAKCRGRELMVLLARVCAEREFAWESNTWATGNKTDELRRPYLAFLVANGYTPSTVENVLLGQTKGTDVLAEMDRIKAQGKLAKAAGATSSVKKNAAGHRTAVKRAPARKVAKRQAPAKKRAPVKKAARRQPFAERAPQARA